MERKNIESKRQEGFSFFGCGDSARIDLPAGKRIYRGIATPIDLYRALSGIWCADTCAPRMRADWTPENRTLGQCSVTAFLAQDIFGGEVRGLTTDNGNIHCYNVVDGIVFDLTSEQFGREAEKLVYDSADPVQERESAGHFGKQEKRERYEYLKSALSQAVGGCSRGQ